VNAISESDGMMEVTFLILDKDLNCLKKGNELLPFNNTHTVLSPVCLDNNGNILLAEASNNPFVSSNIITVYKVEKNNDTISNIVHDVGKKMISDLSMKVDNHNNEYFVYAVAANEEDAVNTFQQEMLSILLNPDLTEKATDQFSILNNTQKDSALNNYENLFISTISRNDSGYEIVCFADGTPGLITSTYTAYHPVYNFDAQSFYRKPIILI
jgi:hypothetical protein